MTLFDNLLRKLAEFLVVLQMFLMASCWPSPLDEYEEGEGEGVDGDGWDQEGEHSHADLDELRRRPIGTVNG